MAPATVIQARISPVPSVGIDPVRDAIEAALDDLDLSPDDVSLAIGQRRSFLTDYLRSDGQQPLESNVSELLARQLGIPAWVLRQQPAMVGA